MSDTPPVLPIDETPEVITVPPGSVAVEMTPVDPEPDEVGGQGDQVQLVSTGWVRFVIAGHGRVRLRPPRFGQLRAIMEAQEEMLDAVQAVADEVGIEGAALQAKADADQKNEALSAEERERRRRGYHRQSREAARRLTRVANTKRAEVWREIHKMLGVSGEEWPDDDNLPVWMLDASLMTQVIVHWQSVPLAPGPAAA